MNIDDAIKKEKEEKSLLKIDDNFKKIIIVRNNIKKWMDEKGILIVSLKEFLTNREIINNWSKKYKRGNNYEKKNRILDIV